MTKTVLVPREINLVQQSIDTSLVVGGSCNLSCSQDLVPVLEVRVKHPVGETSHTDPNTFKHTITSELMHDKWRLNFNGLLVGVGHNATDEVGLSLVKSTHELTKLNKVDRGYGLSTRSLLLLLLFLTLWWGSLSRVVPPQEDQKLILSPLEDVNNCVIDGILVLLKPGSDIVGHSTSVMNDGKVSILVSLGAGLSKWR